MLHDATPVRTNRYKNMAVCFDSCTRSTTCFYRILIYHRGITLHMQHGRADNVPYLSKSVAFYFVYGIKKEAFPVGTETTSRADLLKRCLLTEVIKLVVS